jgi:hypothetical protein
VLHGISVLAALFLSLAQDSSLEIGSEKAAWRRTTSLNTPEAYRTYLRERPAGRYIDIAYGQLRRPIPASMQLAQACGPGDHRLVCLLGAHGRSSDRINTY